jgi:hypothetical protein
MTGPSALAFPGSRTLAGWWRQLAPHQPLALWFAHLILHRVEAPVRVLRPYRPDALVLHLLKTLEFAERTAGPAGPSVSHVDQLLRLGPQVLCRLLADLSREGLAQEMGESYRLAEAGKLALGGGEVPATRSERRSFYFLASPSPAFIALRRVETVPWVAGPDWSFDVDVLADCLRRPPEWKRRHGFPTDVLGLAHEEDEKTDESGTWRRVVLDHPERLPAVLLLAAGKDDAPRLLGFAVRPDNWSLQANDPALEVTDLPEVQAQLTAEPTPEQWAGAWRAWCQPRSLPEAQTDACTVENQGSQLRVYAPPRLIDRLRSARSDALKGEAWVLAGEGHVRKAALLDLVPAKQETTAGPL